MNAPIAPGAHIRVRDAAWRVMQVNRTSTGKSAWHVASRASSFDGWCVD